jgi:hypothetical protein
MWLGDYSMSLNKILITIALFVGFVVIAMWVSRESYYFFNNLLYWMRYNWVTVVVIAVAIGLIGAVAKK